MPRARINRLFVLIIMLTGVAGIAVGQYTWGDIVKDSEPIFMESWGGVGYGEVAEGFASFAIDVAQPGPLTLEVIVTETRQGVEYSDDDSMLFLFTNDALLVAENDDGPYGRQSLINGANILEPGRYYAVVTTYENRPEIGMEGQFDALHDDGLSNISFELLVEYGFRPELADDEFFEFSETVLFLEDFDLAADSIEYTGDRLTIGGTVSDEAVLYRLDVDDFYNISIDVYERYGDYGDTKVFLIDGLGFVQAEDDDSGMQGGSLIPDVGVSPATHYYIAVTTFPNSPNIDDFGLVEGFPANGGGSFEFELVIDGPQEFIYDDYGLEGWETEIWFDQFPELAETLYYDGAPEMRYGEVDRGVDLYRLEIDDSQSLSVEVLPVGEAFTDTVVFLIDQEGMILADDDDGGRFGGSLIADIYLDGPNHYYVAVVSYPNWPNTDSYGYVEGFPMRGSGLTPYELMIDEPKEYGFYDGSFGEEPFFGEPTPDGGFGAYSIDEIADYANFVPLNNGSGVGYGEVGTGFSAFSFRVEGEMYVTVEVVVTEVRQGTMHEDDDTKLSLFGPDGLWYATDDDGGEGGASKLTSIWLPEPGTYYAIVTTYPNEPETQFGFFDYVEPTGRSNVAFELLVSTDFAAQ